MRIGSRKWAFTLIELLVVVAIIALLLSILLPSLAGAREQGKRARCLAHLGGLGKAVYQYASEDRKEQLIPIHFKMLETSDYWEWRTVHWFAWGGRTPPKHFIHVRGAGYWLSDQNPPPAPPATAFRRPQYAAHRRPLNLYMVSGVGATDAQKMEWYMCPSDVGYPDDPSIDDAPIYNAKRACYDTLGNSYRASLNCVIGISGPYSSSRQFAFGPWGHRASTLQDLARTVLFGEPSWFNMIGKDSDNPDEPLVPVPGWHKRVLIDNLVFCDGSARSTKADLNPPFDEATKIAMNVDPEMTKQAQGGFKFWGIRRGTSFKLDVYPVGGAIIWGNWALEINRNPDKWPWRGFQDNLKK